MNYESCINHPAGAHFLPIRVDLVAICEDAPYSVCAAALLAHFESWTNIKLRHRDQAIAHNERDEKSGKPATQNTSLWIYETKNEIKSALYDLFGANRINDNLLWLRDVGYLQCRENPEHKWDRTLQYRLNIDLIQQSINNLPSFINKASTATEQILDDNSVNDQSFASNEAIPKSTDKSTDKSTTKEKPLPLPLPAKMDDPGYFLFHCLHGGYQSLDALADKLHYPLTDSDIALLNNWIGGGYVEQAQSGSYTLTDAGKKYQEKQAAISKSITENRPETNDTNVNFDSFVRTIQDIFAVTYGNALNIYNLVRGRATKGEWCQYRMDSSDPVTEDELVRWHRWYKKSGLTCPQSPDAITRSLLAFRQQDYYRNLTDEQKAIIEENERIQRDGFYPQDAELVSPDDIRNEIMRTTKGIFNADTHTES